MKGRFSLKDTFITYLLVGKQEPAGRSVVHTKADDIYSHVCSCKNIFRNRAANILLQNSF
jgi:hypothetical protein